VHSAALGSVLGRALDPYSDALAEHGFAHHDPDLWRRMAARHAVAIRVRPPDGPPFAFDAMGEPMAADPPAGSDGPFRAVRTAADGTIVELTWSLRSFRASHLPLLLAGLAALVGIVVGSAIWFVQRQLTPLAGLHRAVEALARGDLDVRAPVVRDDEIGRVAAAFNEMKRRVGEMLGARERLLADVSHELRSPIARMKVAVELLPPSREREALDRDLRDMEDLVGVLLEREALRARAEGGDGRLELRVVDLDEVARQVVALHAGRPPGIRHRRAGAVLLEADGALLRLLLNNLVDNALKFSAEGSGPVEIATERSGDRVILRVTDAGPGIPPGTEEGLLEPFAKLDASRGHHAGYGLGLDLCRRIAELHGGSLRLERREPHGTVATATFPDRRPAP
jgi:signal transduction histidine kinase